MLLLLVNLVTTDLLGALPPSSFFPPSLGLPGFNKYPGYLNCNRSGELHSRDTFYYNLILTT